MYSTFLLNKISWKQKDVQVTDKFKISILIKNLKKMNNKVLCILKYSIIRF